MSMIPLVLRLKKMAHREIAKAQDIVVAALYEVFNNAVIHGGTSIWRCYQGNRFSEDVDVYIPRDIKKIERLFELFERKGFIVEKKRIKKNSIYSLLRLSDTMVRFEALFKAVSGSLKEYETVEGNFLTVYTLAPEELIREKAATYLKRQKVRDLYDVFFLLRHVRDISQVRDSLKELVAKFKEPQDGEELKVLLYDGLVPDVPKMLAYIASKV